MPIALPDILQPRGLSLSAYLLSHRVFLYTLGSTIALSATIANALANHSNFYSVAVYLSKSGRSVLVLVNFALLLALGVARMIQHVFFGSLRPMEVERLYDRVWFFVTESLLAFTIFRDEFDIPFGVMFLFLLFVKSFHWLLSDRVEWMNQMPFPGPPTLFHVRIVTLFVVLYLTDAIMILFAIDSVQTKGVGAIVLFASEYAILIASAVNSLAKYTLCAYEHKRAAVRGGENAPPWENKSMYTFYIDLFTDFWKLVTYLGFFVIVITFYGVPLNVVRDVYVTARSFITRLRDLLRYRAATRNMDERYPNATETELTAMSDAACIICREEMVAQTAATPESTAEGDGPNMTPKKLPCGHIFHFHCLRSWLERQQSCPTCRRGVLDGSPAAPTAGQAPGGGQANEDEQALPGLRAGNIFRAFFGVPPAPAPAPVPAPAPQAAPQGAHQPAQALPLRQHGLPAPPAGAPGQHPAWSAGAHPPQQLQPPPVFQGFFGPGRAWQPWHATGQPQEPVAPVEIPPEAPETSSSATSSRAELNAPSSDGAVASPREAAAAAALRRLGGGKASLPIQSSSYTPASSPPPSGASASNATAATNLNLPSLIPLFALSPVQRTGQPSTSYIHQTHHLSPYPQPPPSLSNPVPDPRLPSWSSQTPPPPPQYLPSLTQLPQTLSDEQLRSLDQLTREAIDERLRVLENVSSALQRSIDELARVRSVLPPPPGPAHATTPAANNRPPAEPFEDAASI